MAIAQIGPVTGVLEDLAMAVAAGAVVGSSVIGAAGLFAGWSVKALERRALSDGYVGAAVGALAAAFDVVLHYMI
ncbi:MAG TPA: hypothetical protein VKU40_03025 [Thermoanaerobaculia bacterium]|nr:hypothetical protein [Thermoanaerobaculia bacterium]